MSWESALKPEFSLIQIGKKNAEKEAVSNCKHGQVVVVLSSSGKLKESQILTNSGLFYVETGIF